jgi:sulfur-carrier protein adenylyltransferase/sulfurtransferase
MKQKDRQPLTEIELERYNRHIILDEIGIDGQLKLKNAKVLLIGIGGLGSPIALYLVAAGVGTLGIVDFDTVDYSNLHRQIIHSTYNVGKSKLSSSVQTLKGINPEIEIIAHEGPITSKNALDIIKFYDIVCDGTDNFTTRYLVNDACVLLNKINVFGSIYLFEGQVTVFDSNKGPCYRCLYPQPPQPGEVPSCAEAGVLGVLPGLIGLVQATEIIKLITGKGQPLINRLLLYDALSMSFRELKISKNQNCELCGKNPVIKNLIDYEMFCGLPSLQTLRSIKASELKNIIDSSRPHLLLDVREPHETSVAKIPGAKTLPLKSFNLEELNGIPSDQLIIVYCKAGVRSLQAIRILQDNGYQNLINLEGGIQAWSKLIDPELIVV